MKRLYVTFLMALLVVNATLLIANASSYTLTLNRSQLYDMYIGANHAYYFEIPAGVSNFTVIDSLVYNDTTDIGIYFTTLELPVGTLNDTTCPYMVGYNGSENLQFVPLSDASPNVHVQTNATNYFIKWTAGTATLVVDSVSEQETVSTMDDVKFVAISVDPYTFSSGTLKLVFNDVTSSTAIDLMIHLTLLPMIFALFPLLILMKLLKRFF